jgi:hypothetical protein
MPRLQEIHTNLVDRLQEAGDQGWIAAAADIPLDGTWHPQPESE